MEYQIVMLTTVQEIGIFKGGEWLYETSLDTLAREGWRLFHVGTWIATEWDATIYEAITILQRPKEGIELG